MYCCLVTFRMWIQCVFVGGGAGGKVTNFQFVRGHGERNYIVFGSEMRI